MTLAPGLRLGPYEILSPLGSGGMGEVYRARDTVLHREVAIKVLPEAVALDSDRLARFKREAQVLASLNHSNIGSIYGFEESSGVQALVLELVEGPTLADRLGQGAIPLEEALPIARQIAEALEAAHEQGIVHRDLKPANIKLRPDGRVKVLDFGLAKAVQPVSTLATDVSGSPTITTPAVTHVGVILGTAAYMSPEQAKGRPADKRSDMWAFGCVMFEMLTGRRLFDGEEITETLAFIITREPHWEALPVSTPPPIRRLLRRCLEKDRTRRLADAADARLEIDEALAPGEAADATPVREPASSPWRRARIVWPAGAVVLVTTLALALVASLRRPVDDVQAVLSVIPSPEGTFIGTASVVGAGLTLALSPDGRRLVFVATGSDNRSRLWIRALEGESAEPLAGTEDGIRPFWSPDSRSVGFFAPTDHKLKTVDITSGRVLTLWEDRDFFGGSGTWSADGSVILFTFALAGSEKPEIYRVAPSGGMPTPVTTFDANADEHRHIAPFFLPDGRRFLYTTVTRAGALSVNLASLDGQEKALVLRDAANVQYAAGRLLFVRGTTLLGQPFDVERGVLTGEATPVAQGITIEPFSRTGSFSVSATRLLAYQPVGGRNSQLTWFDRTGNASGVVGEPADYNSVNLSPDGLRAAVSVRDAGGNMDIWLVDVARGVRTRFTVDPADEVQSVWSPDGTRIVFDLIRSPRQRNLHIRAVTGSGADDVIAPSPIEKMPTSWSADGKYLLYNSIVSTPRTGNDVWIAPLFGDRKPYPFLQTPFNEGRAQFAPDGRWIAYQSNESGRNEVYVAPFSGPGGKWQVSTNGGGSPRWRRDGKELFYVASDGTLMTADVNGRGLAFEVGAVRTLFNPRMRDRFSGVPYDVTADGQRILVNALDERMSYSSITLIANWPALLKR